MNIESREWCAATSPSRPTCAAPPLRPAPDALQVGAVTGLVCRAVRQLSAATTGRLALKLTTAGIELDVGGSRRFSETAAAGCAVTVGLQASAGLRPAGGFPAAAGALSSGGSSHMQCAASRSQPGAHCCL